MKALQFTPVVREVPSTNAESTPIHESLTDSASYALRLSDDGGLTAKRLEHGNVAVAADGGGPVVALLRHCRNSREPAWVIVDCAGNVGLNGLTPPLPAALLEPGGLLAIGDRFWVISSLWQPEPMQAPAELRDKPCPVCGGELGLAPVVQCGCGRWTHLENASAPDDKEALNCFMAAGTCGGCGRAASLEPQVFPQVPDMLAGISVDEDDFDWK